MGLATTDAIAVTVSLLRPRAAALVAFCVTRW